MPASPIARLRDEIHAKLYLVSKALEDAVGVTVANLEKGTDRNAPGLHDLRRAYDHLRDATAHLRSAVLRIHEASGVRVNPPDA